LPLCTQFQIARPWPLRTSDAKSDVAHAIECGQLLIARKDGCKHGEWTAICESYPFN